MGSRFCFKLEKGGENTKKTVSKIWFPLAVTLVMVLGGFVVMVPAPGAMTHVGDRGGDLGARDSPAAVSYFDMIMNEQGSNLQTGKAFAGQDELDMTSEEAAEVATLLDTFPIAKEDVVKDIPTFEPETEGTRSPGVDVGGPYGGPGTYEGDTITFTCTADDPALIFFRWDFDNDGIWDTGWRFSMGMSDTISHTYDDDYYQTVMCEAWDGFSQTVTIHSGTAREGDSPTHYASYWTSYRHVGWKFEALAPLQISSLGAYRWTTYWTPYYATFWDADAQDRLGYCYLPSVNYQWNWCSIPTVTLDPGTNYMVAAVGYSYSPYGPLLQYDADVHTTLIDAEIAMYYYYTSSPSIYPQYGPYFSGYLPMTDFSYYWKEVQLQTFSDTAEVTVNNIAPVASDFQVTPSIGKEGEEVYFYGKVSDAGTADEWRARVHFGDGEVSDWLSVQKWQYTPAAAAKVLMADTWSVQGPGIQSRLASACGGYCTVVDRYNWYTSGSPPDPDYMNQYDVVLVGVNYIPSTSLCTSMGTALADYSDQGGGVVTMWGSNINVLGYDMLGGRWSAEEYNPMSMGGYGFGWYYLGDVYEPGHPIMAGVTGMGAYYTYTIRSVTSGATRVADFTDGSVLAAEKENPVVGGSSIVDLGWFPSSGYSSGDDFRVMVNAIKFVAMTKSPLPHPLDFGPIAHVYADDNPSTTPYDTYEATIEVADDDHGTVAITKQDILFEEDFGGSPCDYYSFPSPWINDYTHWHCGYSSYMASQAAYANYNFYTYYGDLELVKDFDMSAYTSVRMIFRHNLDMTWPYGETHAIVRGSLDGGSTWPYIVAEWHHDGSHPASSDAGWKEFWMPWAAGQSSVRFQWHLYIYDDWWWHWDDLSIEGVEGFIVQGNDTMSGEVTIENVPPEEGGSGHPSSDFVDELATIIFQDYVISDNALNEPTEWFAYRWDMDDGTSLPWIFKGSMAPPENVLNVLLVHSYCDQYSPNCESGDAATTKNLILNHPSVYNVDLWDLFNRLVAPSITAMQNYDVIMTGFNWGWNPDYEPRWITVREDLGDRLADYLDMNAGGVATITPSLDNTMFAGAPVFRLLGRYVADKYAPYEIATTSFTSGPLGEIFEPNHPVMNGVESGSVSNSLQGGDHDVTIGGGGNAAGQNGLNLADWANEFSAVGAKELANDAFTCHVNGFGPYMTGPSATLLTGNCALYAWGAGPTPKIPDFAYIYGDNGEYNVDLMLVDDDMGWVWDGTNLVADPRYPQTMTHSYTSIAVNNVDPTIQSVSATIDMDLCIRMSGNKGNMATLTLTGSDGYFDQVVAKRVPGKPVEACLDTATLDLTPRTQYEVGIKYDPEDDDGANPTWIFQTKFPDGKIKELRHTFQSDLGVQTWLVANKQVKRLAIGQEVHFDAVASDPGSDDLAFIWGWSDRTPYDICIYEHPGTFWGCAESDYLEELPFPEPDFTIAANSMRSPEVDPIRARDHQTHTFSEQYMYYVWLTVADDDVKDLYPSPYLTPGLDIELIELDF